MPRGGYQRPRHTPECQRTICDAIRMGLPRERAAALAGVSRQVIGRWLDEGEKGKEPYRSFAAALYLAEAEMIRWCLNEIRKAGTKVEKRDAKGVVTETVTVSPQWQAKAWMLERRFRGDFGLKSRGEEPAPDEKDGVADPALTRTQQFQTTRRLRRKAEADGSYVAAANLLRLEVEVLAQIEADQAAKDRVAPVGEAMLIRELRDAVASLPESALEQLREALAQREAELAVGGPAQ